MSGSTRSFTATALILIGRSPAAWHGSMPCEHLVEIVAPRDLREALAVERIEVDVEAAQPGIVERLAPARPAARRWWSAPGRRCPGMAASCSISTGRSRRTSGSPPVTRSLLIPSPTATRTKRSISSKVRISRAVHELHVRLRHAVEAADVAAVGDADAQIVVHAAEGIDERCGMAFT